MVVGCQPYAPAAFTPRNVPGTRFHLGAESTPGPWFGRKNPVTPPGIDPGTVRLVAQRLNRYATPGPIQSEYDYKTHLPLRDNDANATSFIIPFVGSFTGGAVVNTATNLTFPEKTETISANLRKG